MKRRVMLITGANGFLARAVARQAHSDWRLAGLVRHGTTITSSYFHTAHMSVDDLINDLDRVDVVLHLAACIPAQQDATSSNLTAVNVNLVEQLIEAYPSSRHVLASSVSVFGSPISLPLTIGTAPHQPNAYGLSKLAAEELVCQTPEHAVIRFSSLIGIGMKTGSFIPAIITSARTGKIRLLGNGERLQNYLDIDDAALMCLKAAISKDSFVALGVSERSYSNNEVALLVADLTGASIVREGEDPSPSYVYDASQSVALGKHGISLKDTLEKMVQQT